MINLKEIALILSPLVAVLVAAVTIWFNAYDRRRHYALEREKLTLEREKLAKDIAKALLAGSKSLEKRIDLYNQLFSHISSIAQEARRALDDLSKTGHTEWQTTRVSDSLDRLVTDARSAQVFTTQFIHKAITREFATMISRHAAEVAELLSGQSANRSDAAINRLTQMLQESETLKERLRDDLETYVRGLANVPI